MESIARIKIDCPVCGCNRFQVFCTPRVKVDDPVKLYGAASGVPGAQTLVTCRECRLVYENPRFPEAIILNAYKSSIEGGHDSQYGRRVESFRKALQSLADRLPGKGSRVLDVGTAGGAFLEAAGSLGYDAHGLEPSQYLVDQGLKRALNVRQGTIVDVRYPEASFDMICLWDVLEHLVDPLDALRRLKPSLKSTGIMLINYPDIGTPMAKLFGRRFWWLLSVHLTHFSRHSIRVLADRTGYEVVSFKNYFQTLEFGYLMKMAAVYKIPLSGRLESLMPVFLKRIPVPYYASQTTALLRIKP